MTTTTAAGVNFGTMSVTDREIHSCRKQAQFCRARAEEACRRGDPDRERDWIGYAAAWDAKADRLEKENAE